MGSSTKMSIEKVKTYCMLSSSGSWKSSTLLNNFSGATVKTDTISKVQTKEDTLQVRELIVLENGGILIDNPGMREVGIADKDRIENNFSTDYQSFSKCKFKDCTHTNEIGCAVLDAVEWEIDKIIMKTT